MKIYANNTRPKIWSRIFLELRTHSIYFFAFCPLSEKTRLWSWPHEMDLGWQSKIPIKYLLYGPNVSSSLALFMQKTWKIRVSITLNQKLMTSNLINVDIKKKKKKEAFWTKPSCKINEILLIRKCTFGLDDLQRKCLHTFRLFTNLTLSNINKTSVQWT